MTQTMTKTDIVRRRLEAKEMNPPLIHIPGLKGMKRGDMIDMRRRSVDIDPGYYVVMNPTAELAQWSNVQPRDRW